MLKKISERFRTVLREGDTLARLGGDEFALISDDIEKPENAGIIVEKLIQSLQKPFVLNSHEITMTISIGIAVYPYAGDTFEDLVRHADIALYKAKESGRNTFRYFTQSLNVKINRRLQLGHSLREAIEKKELYLCYQPIFCLVNGDLYGVEALLRWNNLVFGEISPSEIIPIAEDVGLIVSLGYWIIEEALRQYQTWKAHTTKSF